MSLVFHHVQQLSRNLNQYLNEALEGEDIFMSHWAILFKIHSNEGCLTQAELKERLNIEAPPLSRAIAKLESLGYIEKYKSEDQRTNDIRMTEAGLKRYPYWQKAIQQAEERLLSRFGEDREEELESHVLTLSRMIAEERGKC
ncbi:DNA-binding transcriptional regulator, MarR family [Halobacillus karajensis]|uniref:Transcriptional regulator SlyA n=1 Tax=Halobacillus karajensis TaxID=195088 RepID=A0A024P3Z1_9BACI|nr:MarR family transcriptional regulator [Halobacillus karajensis]CDQ18713.1 transcriptional regulator SlyA [Halobacillus karajensis]CDQ23215.1 transcriptional regulator SlyA [Halobacillus karajensis]CDQ26697.1 transcriptional regulator SlyA [Halobacillus karajensis]SEH47681.1 DNA-binding transcriptional regulator, MarR family [Halobacillus karajensis]